MSGSIQYLYAIYMASIDGIVMSALKARSIGKLKGWWVFPFAMLIYAFQPIAFYFGLSFESMTVLNVLWDVLSDIIVAIIGIFVFGEHLSTQQCIGLAFCMAGIVLLGMH